MHTSKDSMWRRIWKILQKFGTPMYAMAAATAARCPLSPPPCSARRRGGTGGTSGANRRRPLKPTGDRRACLGSGDSESQRRAAPFAFKPTPHVARFHFAGSARLSAPWWMPLPRRLIALRFVPGMVACLSHPILISLHWITVVRKSGSVPLIMQVLRPI